MWYTENCYIDVLFIKAYYSIGANKCDWKLNIDKWKYFLTANAKIFFF